MTNWRHDGRTAGDHRLADVFISYKRRVRPRVAALAEALEQLKVSVWFDAEIEPGKSFGAVINRELGDARCVLVCWTPDAFAPEHGDDVSWVEAEATMGRERKVLVPVLFEKTILNAPWNMLQTENLTEWTPDAAPTGAWLGVLAGIGRLVGRPGLADYARATASGSTADLARWAKTYPDDPLASGVEDRIAERAAATPAPGPAPAPQQEAPAPLQPQPTPASPSPMMRRPMAWWRILILAAVFVLGGVSLFFGAVVWMAPDGSAALAASTFYVVVGIPLVALGWFLRRKWSRA